jgi:hypothetical protein
MSKEVVAESVITETTSWWEWVKAKAKAVKQAVLGRR